MGVDQKSRPLSWDVAMMGRVLELAEEADRQPLQVQVADRSAILIASPEAGWEAALSIARAVAVDTDYRCIVVRCKHGTWQVWLTDQRVGSRPQDDIAAYLNE